MISSVDTHSKKNARKKSASKSGENSPNKVDNVSEALEVQEKILIPEKSPIKSKPIQKPREDGSWNCGDCGHLNASGDWECGGCGQKLPVITLFKTSRREIILGKPIRLNWEVEDADHIQLLPIDEGPMTPKGVMNILPTETTQYTLVATNKIGTRTLSLSTVLAAPQIKSFEAAESEIHIGYPTILHWEVENGAKLDITMGIGDVSGKSFTEAFLTEPGVCTLTATNPSGSDSVSIDLTLSLPEIHSFFAGVKVIKSGIGNVLNWDVGNAKEIWIDREVGEVTGQTSTTVFPEKTCTYTLRAINAIGTVRKSVELILPPPEIVYFGGNETLSTEGKPIEITWDVENAFRITIDQGIGEIPPRGSMKVRPQQAFTDYTLTAEGYSGTEKRVFQVVRFPIPLDEDAFVKDPDFKLDVQIHVDMEINEHEMQHDLGDLDQLERELKMVNRDRLREIRIQKVKEMELTDDLLAMEKASLRSEIQAFFRRFKRKFGIKKT